MVPELACVLGDNLTKFGLDTTICLPLELCTTIVFGFADMFSKVVVVVIGFTMLVLVTPAEDVVVLNKTCPPVVVTIFLPAKAVGDNVKVVFLLAEPAALDLTGTKLPSAVRITCIVTGLLPVLAPAVVTFAVVVFMLLMLVCDVLIALEDEVDVDGVF